MLHFFHMYMLGCNYFWMLCEGIYLHTLIVVAVFAEEQHLHWYYLLGWGESVYDHKSISCVVSTAQTSCCVCFFLIHSVFPVQYDCSIIADCKSMMMHTVYDHLMLCWIFLSTQVFMKVISFEPLFVGLIDLSSSSSF